MGLIILTICSVIVYQFVNSGFDVLAIEPRLFFSLVVAVAGIVKMIDSPAFYKSHIAKSYADIIGNAFAHDRRSYNLLMKALILYNQNKNNKALSLLRKLLPQCVSRRDSAVVWFFIGACYDDLGQFASAAEAYESSVQNDLSIGTAHSNLGIIYKNGGDYEEALKCYENALAVDRDNHFAYNNLAYVYLDLLEPDKAIEYAMEALKIKANMQEAMQVLALAYSMKHENDKAQEYYQKSVMNGCENPAKLKQMMSAMGEK
jgi:tetratricopeptide (TPR) repeat protein